MAVNSIHVMRSKGGRTIAQRLLLQKSRGLLRLWRSFIQYYSIRIILFIRDRMIYIIYYDDETRIGFLFFFPPFLPIKCRAVLDTTHTHTHTHTHKLIARSRSWAVQPALSLTADTRLRRATPPRRVRYSNDFNDGRRRWPLWYYGI